MLIYYQVIIFFCLDININAIRKASEKLRELVKKYSDFNPLKVTLSVNDGRELPFPNNSIDVVILPEVLSAPPPGTTPVNEPYPPECCISFDDKWKMIEEALRVLKDGGIFIVDICMTPCYAVGIMQEIERNLIKKGRIQLLKQCGEFVGQSDNWHLYHAAFQKKPGLNIKSVEMIPWTQAQKDYISQYAVSFMTW